MRGRNIGYLIVIGLFSFAAQGQYIPDNLEYYEKYRKPAGPAGDLYAQFGAGISLPMASWGAQPSPNLPLLAPFLGEDGMGAGTGYFINFSQMVPINAFSSPNNTYWGFKWGAELANHGSVDWTEVIEKANSQYSDFNLSFLLGPTYNIRMGEKWVIELGGTFNFSVWSGQTELGTIPGDNPLPTDFDITPASPDEGPEMVWQPGYSLSLGVRIRHWKIYGELYTQNVKRYFEFTSYSNQDESIQGFNSDYTISTFRIGIAYLFMNT